MPILEIALLIQVGEVIGGWNTVGFVLLTAFVGAYLVKREGLSTLSQAQQKMNQGVMPGDELAQGLLLLVAGVLLVTPGFVTDAIGMLFTLPPTRKLLAKQVLHKLVTSNSVHTSFTSAQGFQQPNPFQQHTNTSQDSDIIEGEFHETGHSELNDLNRTKNPD